MSSKRHVRRKACEGKLRHKNRQEAMGHLFWMRRQGLIDGQPFDAYVCKFCKQWHIGHRRGQKFR